MRGSLVAVLFLLLSALASAQTPTPEQSGGRGTLTLIVRDAAGLRLAGVSITLVHDTDLDGLVTLGMQATDAAGSVIYPDLAWGLYLVQFSGTSPDGRPLLPLQQQNLGLLEDGGALSGGFGVRFAEPDRTELFVLGNAGGTSAAVPMFDLAPSSDAPPQPIDPVLALATGPTPTPTTLREALAAAAPPPRRGGRFDAAVLWCLAGVLVVFAVLIAVGIWRSRRPPPPKGTTP